ncbi:hypothetical protein EQP59_05400 [Ornithobacterium rhinotracheale]|uniref:OmpA-like domain-containing protein n=1 Tax=Ornithobacterium rhinotracheale TaxID=28251 RepID=A0A3R6AUG7_ORNRH|nr:OmpA family protein [Ornithobacterium rhinotracheale]QAR30809.1 hypothetical protein EQP59_05400 [Ornithobacterium rhinotracheale]
MKKTMVLAGLAALMMTSCVSKKKYSDLQSEFEKVYAAQQSAQNQLVKCNSDNDLLRAQLQGKDSNLASLQNALEQCMSTQKSGNINITRLIEQIDNSNKYIRRLIDSKSKSDSLNMVLTNNLTRSLSREELRDIDVQVQKGVVFISLSDNMLYNSGSYEVNSQAYDVLSKIAKIIKDYPDYDVLVEGNTDNIPISKTNIRNNWDLSALRAASVVKVLQDKFGVDPKRMTAGGRGEYNTVATNGTAEGRAKNRRTEIIILPNLDQFMELIGQAPAK